MYVVVGAGGNTGASVARALLAAGEPVRALVRSEEKAAPWRARGAEAVVADARDPDALARALAGAKGAYLMNPPDYAAEDPYGQAERTAEAWARAIEASGLPHAVVLSSQGAQKAEGSGLIGTLHRIERRLGALDRPVTFLRPSYFLENWGAVLDPVLRQGVLPSFLDLDRPVATVASADIGAAAAALLADPAPARRTVELTGPREESPRAVAEAFSRLLGRPVAPVRIPREGWAAAAAELPFSQAARDGLLGIYAGIEDGALPFEGTPRRGTVGLEDGLRPLLR
jgi:uncharacterized protein YbjT (DUF2867 family)